MAEASNFRCTIEWSGPSADYDTFSRNHRVSFPGKPPIEVSAAPEYRGDPTCPNPEDLLVAALASCQMLTYVGMAAASKVEVLEYRDEAVGTLEKSDGRVRMTRVVLRPRIVIGKAANRDRALGLVSKAHDQCFISNSVTTQVTVEPEITAR